VRISGQLAPAKNFVPVCYVVRNGDVYHPGCYDHRFSTGGMSRPMIETLRSAWPRGKPCAFCKGKSGAPKAAK
jgi:hypothetical protein